MPNDLRDGLGLNPEYVPILVSTPSVIYNNLYILGGRTLESPDAVPGHIQMHNVLSEALEWIFHTIPQPGELGYEKWLKDACKTAGGLYSGNLIR